MQHNTQQKAKFNLNKDDFSNLLEKASAAESSPAFK